jgi:hypothetical protein
MDGEISLLLWGAAAGLMSGVGLELAKHWFERGRTAGDAARELQNERLERVAGFWRGESVQPDGGAPGPAWLRQVSSARRYPLARLGLRSDEDYSTDSHPLCGPKPSGGNRTLLKTFRRRGRRARRPVSVRGGKFLLGQAHLLGRGGKCDIQVLDPAVSLLHAFIRFEGDRFMLYDLGSTGGTFVNDDPVGPFGRPLAAGDQIRIGSTTFEFGRAARGLEVDPVDTFLID